MTENIMEKAEARILLLYLLKQFKAVCSKADIPYYASGGTCLGAIRHKGIIPWDDDIDVMIPRKYYDIFVETCSSVLPGCVLVRTRENDPYFCGEYIKLCYTDDVKRFSDLSIDVFLLDETNPKRKLFRAIQNRLLLDLYFIKTYKVSRIKGTHKYTPHNIFRRIQVVTLGCILPSRTIEKWHKRIMLGEKSITDYYVNWGSCYSYIKATYSKTALGVPQEVPFENTTIAVAENPEEILVHLYGPDYMTPPPVDKRKDHGVTPINCSTINIDELRNEISGTA